MIEYKGFINGPRRFSNYVIDLNWKVLSNVNICSFQFTSAFKILRKRYIHASKKHSPNLPRTYSIIYQHCRTLIEWHMILQ